MKPGQIVYEDISPTGKPLLIRYLDKGDTQILLDYINTRLPKGIIYKDNFVDYVYMYKEV